MVTVINRSLSSFLPSIFYAFIFITLCVLGGCLDLYLFINVQYLLPILRIVFRLIAFDCFNFVINSVIFVLYALCVY